MAKRKLQNPEQLSKREDELLDFCNGGSIHWDQYNKYHFRLFYKGNILDVWPTSKKYWNSKMSKSRVYSSVEELGNFLFS